MRQLAHDTVCPHAWSGITSCSKQKVNSVVGYHGRFRKKIVLAVGIRTTMSIPALIIHFN